MSTSTFGSAWHPIAQEPAAPRSPRLTAGEAFGRTAGRSALVTDGRRSDAPVAVCASTGAVVSSRGPMDPDERRIAILADAFRRDLELALDTEPAAAAAAALLDGEEEPVESEPA